jgi:quinol monooxygenase YgiN
VCELSDEKIHSGGCLTPDVLVNHTTIRLKSSKRSKAMELIDNLREYSQAEDGTVHYRAMTDVGDSDVVRFFEQYEDVDAAEAHTESEQYRQFVESLPEIVEGTIETIQIHADGVERAEFTPEDALKTLD